MIDTPAHLSSVLAVVGMAGAGKSQAVEYFSEHYSVQVIYFGGVVMGELAKRGLAVTEDNEANVRVELRRDLGMAAMAIKSFDKIEAALRLNKYVVIDGLYSYSEYCYLRERLGERLILLAVHAPRSTRVLRLSSRTTRPLSEEEVNMRDKREIEQLEKGGPIALADYHVINSRSIWFLYDQLENVATTCIRGL